MPLTTFKRWIGRLRLSWKALLALSMLLGMLIAAGIVIVGLKIREEQNDKLEVMGVFGQDAASEAGQTIRSALSALQLGVPMVGRNPRPEQLAVIPPARYRDWLALAPEGAARNLVFFAQGLPVVVYPPLNAGVLKYLNMLNVLEPEFPWPLSMRNNTLYGMATGKATLQEVSAMYATTSLLVVFMPIFVNASSPNETWGWSENMTAPECRTGLPPCYNAATGQKWWGSMGITVGRQELLDSPSIKRLRESGYGYRVSITEDTPGLYTPAAMAPLVMFTNLVNRTCVTATKRMSNQLMDSLQVVLEICIVDNWEVAWRTPVLVAVVLVSLGLVLLTACTVMTWVRHSELVRALLPDSAIQQLTRNLSDPSETTINSTGSPAEKMLTMLGMLIAGVMPPTQEAIQLMGALKQQADLWRPVDLEEHVRQAAGMDGEVAAALMATLVTPSSLASGRPALVSGRLALPGPLRISLGSMKSHQAADGGDGEASPRENSMSLLEALQAVTGLAAGDLHTTPPIAVHNPLASFAQTYLGPNRPSLIFSVVDEDEFLCTKPEEKTGNGFLDKKRSQGLAAAAALGQSAASLRAVTPSLSNVGQVLSLATSLRGDFDAWKLAEASQGHPLAAMGVWCFHQSGVMQDMGLPSHPLIRFLLAVEAGYNDTNPYHNRVHAADVLQSVHALIHTGGLRGRYTDSFTTCACYLAALIHDYDHRGVTNDYLITTKADLALRYNDRSPHENHHVSAGFCLLCQPQNNFLQHLPPSEWVKMRKLVIDLVLATDMKQHFAINGQFSSVHRLSTGAMIKRITHEQEATVAGYVRTVATQPSPQHSMSVDLPVAPALKPYRLLRPKSQLSQGLSANGASTSRIAEALPDTPPQCRIPSYATRTAPAIPTLYPLAGDGGAWETPFFPANGDPENVADAGPAPVDEAERLLSLQMMLKCADLGHICASLDIHLKWVAALESEMFLQGDKERAQGLPISPLCDRAHVGVTKSQIGFFEVVVLPLLTNFTARFPATRSILDAATANFQYWRMQTALSHNNTPSHMDKPGSSNLASRADTPNRNDSPRRGDTSVTQ